MMMSRAKQSTSSKRKTKSNSQTLPVLSEFIAKRDFTGALALLDFNRKSGESEDDVSNLMWIGYR